MKLLPLVLVLALAGFARSQGLPPKGASSPRRPSLEASALRDRVFYAAGETGGLLACGTTYQASFDARGATYVPFLGPEATRTFPVTFRLESLALGSEAIPFGHEIFTSPICVLSPPAVS